MAQKVFDIIPPYPEPEPPRRSHKAVKERKKSRKNFLAVVFSLFLIFVIWFFVKNENFLNLNTQNNPAETKKQPFELFNNEGNSNLTDQKIKIQMTDASGDIAFSGQVADTLTQNGFIISQTERSPEAAVKTIIYYQSGEIAEAQKAQKVLQGIISSELKQAVNLNGNFDLAITLGQK